VEVQQPTQVAEVVVDEMEEALEDLEGEELVEMLEVDTPQQLEETLLDMDLVVEEVLLIQAILMLEMDHLE
jgi:hypothetical protein